MIVCDERNPKATGLLAGLRKRLGDAWQPANDLGIVIGGDGFLLRTVATHGMDRPWLGLNAGNLGFLLNDAQDLDRVVSLLDSGRYKVHEFPIVVAKVICADGSEIVERAVNDVYLERMTGQAARLRLVIDGHEVVEQLVADGLIFATALGSTAYAYSAGGQPLHPLLKVMQVTPICAHQPRIPSVALPADARAEVEVLQHAWRPVRAVADGRALDNVLKVEVGLGETGVKLAYLESHDFTGRLLRKIVHP